MGHMKDLDIRIRSGGDDAVAAACELMPRWIPVSERLPEEEQEVLVWNGGGQCLKPWQGHVLCEYRNGEWRESQESDLYPGITHWMPLPAPPANYPELS
jgi:hypothetical protein